MKSQRSFVILLLTVVASRIPLLFGGFGADGDAWRIAHTAHRLWTEGVYQVSRFPGFPVFEILQTPVIILGGSFASNLSTLIVFLFSIILFRSIILRWNIPNADLLLISYSFLPILWKNSAVTMDYIWGLTGILGAVTLLLNKRFISAGIVLGFAAGTRLSHLALFFPLLLLFNGTERKQMLHFTIWSVMITILCYFPVFLSDDFFGVIQEYLARTNNISLLKKTGAFFYRIIFSLGLLGSLAIGIVLFISREKVRSHMQSRTSRVSLAIILTIVVVFSLIPDEREYLIPAMPFLLILLALTGSRNHFAVVTVVLISYAFISLDVTDHDPLSPSTGLKKQKGFVVKEYGDRSRNEQRRIHLAQYSIPDSSIVMIGMGPIFWYDNPYVTWDQKMERKFRQDCARSLRGKEVYYIYALKKPQLTLLRQRGYTVYYWDEMKLFLETFIGYNLADERIAPVSSFGVITPSQQYP
ncbi:MAG: hypothetical protein WCW35_15110 [Bacteroidota bacterium]|jgi:hypothetical protein